MNPFVEQAFEHATFFTRLHQFVPMSDAYIVAPRWPWNPALAVTAGFAVHGHQPLGGPECSLMRVATSSALDWLDSKSRAYSHDAGAVG